ncbi:UNVERIFIED_CONTAM: hypothetical protein HDU68_012486 [Siphonaria sp. JEL0065]|nr:hypothetical protein HDU68_012486 [Siphonaria sp. JEL0065]
MTVIDDHLATLPTNQKEALQHLRSQILAVIPNAQECISYGLPCFKVKIPSTNSKTQPSKAVCGFAALRSKKSKKEGALDLAFYPFSGSTLATVKEELEAFGLGQGTKSSLHFSGEKGLSDQVVELLVKARLNEMNGGKSSLSKKRDRSPTDDEEEVKPKPERKKRSKK